MKNRINVHRTLSLALLVALITCAAVAITSQRAQGSSEAIVVNSNENAAKPVAPSQQENPRANRVQIVRIFAHADDIYPGFARVRPGRVRLVAENETQKDVSIVLERVNPGASRTAVLQVNSLLREKRSSGELTVGAGEYEFYVDGNPDVRGTLIVDSQL